MLVLSLSRVGGWLRISHTASFQTPAVAQGASQSAPASSPAQREGTDLVPNCGVGFFVCCVLTAERKGKLRF